MCTNRSDSCDMSKGNSFTRVSVRLSAAVLLVLVLHFKKDMDQRQQERCGNNHRFENLLKKFNLTKKVKGEARQVSGI